MSSDCDSSDSVEYASNDELSKFERRVLKLKRRRDRAFAAQFEDGIPLKASAILPVIKSEQPRNAKPVRKRKRRSSSDFVSSPRKSLRLDGKRASYVGLDFDYEEKPLRRRRHSAGGPLRSYTPRVKIRSVDFNPDSLTGEVVYNSSKVYSSNGTTCHQCRQKTIDLKSRCYSPFCSGVRGQFCGYCLMGRYGEDVAVVLRDRNWKCPPCRKICNCSICRRHHGKTPTGQLKNVALDQGFNSVKEYLANRGDDFLSGSEADDEDGDADEDLDRIKVERTDDEKENLEPVVKLERLRICYDDSGNPRLVE